MLLQVVHKQEEDNGGEERRGEERRERRGEERRGERERWVGGTVPQVCPVSSVLLLLVTCWWSRFFKRSSTLLNFPPQREIESQRGMKNKEHSERSEADASIAASTHVECILVRRALEEGGCDDEEESDVDTPLVLRVRERERQNQRRRERASTSQFSEFESRGRSRGAEVP